MWQQILVHVLAVSLSCVCESPLLESFHSDPICLLLLCLLDSLVRRKVRNRTKPSVHLFLQNLFQADLSETNVFRFSFFCVNFPEQHHIFTSDDENTTRDVPVALAHVNSLYCLV